MTQSSASQQAVAVVDTRAVTHNLARVRELAPGRRVYAAIKADAYGHGAMQLAPALQDADGFAVAHLDEAMQLRWVGIDKPIVLLSQILDGALVARAAEHALEPIIAHADQLACVAAHRGRKLRVWGMVDSGMHRLGFHRSAWRRWRLLWRTIRMSNARAG